MTIHSMYVHILIQWINFLGIVLLVGAAVFRWAVLNRALMVLEPISPDMERAKAASHRDLKQTIGRCLILLGVVSLMDMLLRAQMMSGKPFSEVFAILPLVIFKTHVGNTWLVKMAILCLFGGLWFTIKESPRPGQQTLLLLACTGLCFTTSLSGHAADKGNFSVPLIVDWLHVMAVSSWTGGLIPLRFLMPGIMTVVDKKDHLKLQAAVVSRFSWLAVRCVMILTLTGMYSAYLQLKIMSALVTTPYGITLMFKLAFVAPMLGLGALGRYYIRPALQKLAGEPARGSFTGQMAKRVVSLLGGRTGSEDYHTLQRGYGSARVAMLHLQVFVALQCLLFVVVLGLAALLTHTSPPRATEFSPPVSPDTSYTSQTVTTDQKTMLLLRGSYCKSYPREITKALLAMKGVKTVDLNSMHGHAVVVHDSTVQPKSLVESIKNIKGTEWCSAEVMDME